ncbi:MAG: hypothetical protein H8D34_16555 [Chloroflexi bacterium]|nr:hypothetical protein [Chloroflexota bacterium]
MNKSLRNIVIVVVILIGATALVWTGFAFGRSSAWAMGDFYPAGMMSSWIHNQGDEKNQYGYGMMGGDYSMSRNYGNLGDVEPLSVEETREAVESYLASYGEDDLAIKEIMIFEYNAYAIIVEESSGIGAFELLVDPVTKAVFPEYGPNMMWNLKYGMHAGSGFGGHGMMGGNSQCRGGMPAQRGFEGMDGFGYDNQWDVPDVSTEMTISAEEAEQIAQEYLDANALGFEVSHEITAFYGYYTIDTEKDGDIIGMLSVNGFTGQVFPHTWHGDFIEMVEADHD